MRVRRLGEDVLVRGEGWRVKGLGRGLCACHAYHAYTTVTHTCTPALNMKSEMVPTLVWSGICSTGGVRGERWRLGGGGGSSVRVRGERARRWAWVRGGG